MTHRNFGLLQFLSAPAHASLARAEAAAVNVLPRRPKPTAAVSIQTVRVTLRGQEQPLARLGAVTRADSVPFPAGSIPRRPPLKSAEFSSPLLDVVAALSAFLLVSVTGLGIAFGFFVLLFVNTQGSLVP